MSEKPQLDEFEKRMHLAGFVTSITDAVTKLNPSMLIGTEAKTEIEATELKSQYQNAMKKWLDLLMHCIDKTDKCITPYPIESILGIKDAQS